MTQNEERYYVVGGSIADAAGINDKVANENVHTSTGASGLVLATIHEQDLVEMPKDMVGLGNVQEGDDINGYWIVGGIPAATETEEEEEGKAEAGLAFSQKTKTVTIGNEFTAPTLTNEHNLEVTYSSSNEEVATVAADGTLTLVAAGTTTITATSAETEEYLAGEASYTLTVRSGE